MGEGNGRVLEALEGAGGGLARAPAGGPAVYRAGTAAYHQAARWQTGSAGFFAAIGIAQC